MALRNQPYLPLYVQDFMTDEKLAECSAQTTGVYIRIMCIMHKSDEYGKILLRQTQRQSGRQEENFAAKLAIHLPYPYEVILSSIEELLEFGILTIENGALCQKRMIRDNKISEARSISGAKGASITNNKNQNEVNFAETFASANKAANTENESEVENDIVNKTETKNKTLKFDFSFVEDFMQVPFMEWIEYKTAKKKGYKTQKSLQACYAEMKNLSNNSADTAIKIVNKSMANNWDGLFALKQNEQGNNARLGIGEFLNTNGNRTYGTSGVIVPNDAPPRPSTQHIWSKIEQLWKIM